MFDRTAFIEGPAIAVYDSTVMYIPDSFELVPDIRTFEVPVSSFGDVDKRRDTIVWSCQFTPYGKAGLISKLLPYLNPTRGTSIYGATDKTIVIHSHAGQRVTIHGAGIAQQPDLILSAVDPLWGPVTVTAIGKKAVAWDNASRFAEISATAFSDTSFDPDDIITQPYTLAWGASSPWDAIAFDGPVTISSQIELYAKNTNADGLVDQRISQVKFTASFRPQGISEAQLLALAATQDTGVVRGSSMRGNANNLVATGANGVVYTLFQTTPTQIPFVYGDQEERAGELVFETIRKIASGVPTALMSVA